MSGLVTWEWDGQHMVPLDRHAAQCKRDYKVGERYVLEAHEAASHKSRGHYFACVREAWDNLHEDLQLRFPNPEFLRKWALCKTGWCEEQFVALSTEQEARQVAAMARFGNRFAVIEVKETTVRVLTPRSQRTKRLSEGGGMSREEFQRSKDDVLTFLAGMLDVKKHDLERWGGRSA